MRTLIGKHPDSAEQARQPNLQIRLTCVDLRVTMRKGGAFLPAASDAPILPMDEGCRPQPTGGEDPARQRRNRSAAA